MKKTLSIILVLIFSFYVFTGCTTQTENKNENEVKEQTVNVIHPLPETLDISNLDNCTASVSLEKGDVYVDDSGKMVMNATIYSYELYDMVDIASLKENDVIVRRNEEVTVEELERLESGLVRINGGEENGGFDLISNDNTVYYEIGMNDAKAYNEIGEAILPVSTEFVFTDSSDIEATKEYYPGDFLADDTVLEYNFFPNSTSIVIKDGVIIEMTKVYTP